MSKHFSLFVIAVAVCCVLFVLGTKESSATPAAVEWKAQELSAYLAYMQDGHSGIGDFDVVYLDRARVPDKIIERALEYKKELDDSKRKFIVEMNELIQK